MTIHQNYARLSLADRSAVDEAFNAAYAAFRSLNRKTDNGDAAEHLVEALATYLIESDGAARVGGRPSHTAPLGDIHESY